MVPATTDLREQLRVRQRFTFVAVPPFAVNSGHCERAAGLADGTIASSTPAPVITRVARPRPSARPQALRAHCSCRRTEMSARIAVCPAHPGGRRQIQTVGSRAFTLGGPTSEQCSTVRDQSRARHHLRRRLRLGRVHASAPRLTSGALTDRLAGVLRDAWREAMPGPQQRSWRARPIGTRRSSRTGR